MCVPKKSFLRYQKLIHSWIIKAGFYLARLIKNNIVFLLSWLQSIPTDTFSVPFEQKTLNVDVERLEKPGLETSWSEWMLITPIKPKTFPHSVMPFTRPKSAADIMTRSLLPSYDAVSSVMGK